MKAENNPHHNLDNAARIRIGELTEVGATMTEEELKAVSGARSLTPSWTSGSPAKTDEWQR